MNNNWLNDILLYYIILYSIWKTQSVNNELLQKNIYILEKGEKKN